MLLYGTEVCPQSHIASFQFVVNSCSAKIFNTMSKDVINDCHVHFYYSSRATFLT